MKSIKHLVLIQLVLVAAACSKTMEASKSSDSNSSAGSSQGTQNPAAPSPVVTPAPVVTPNPNPVPTPVVTPSPAPTPPVVTPNPTPTPMPNPTPTPSPILPVSQAYQDIISAVGPVSTVASVEALGGDFLKYEQNFRTFAEKHWADTGASWENGWGNYYDRAKIYYVYYARTGNKTYLDRANAMAVDYRDKFLVPGDYGTSAHWSQMAGIYLHAKVNNNAASRLAVEKVAALFAMPYYFNNLQDVNAEMDNRIQARTLTAFLYAYQLSPSSQGYDWASMMRQALTKILASQSADGAYRFSTVQCGQNKNFMTALVNDAMIEYYNRFEKDPRILPAIKKSLDFMWSSSWSNTAQAMTYLSGPCAAEGPAVDSIALAPDLNNMMLPGFGFVYAQTGDPLYKTRGDALLKGGVAGAWLVGGKQFNESYTNSYKYFVYRSAR